MLTQGPFGSHATAIASPSKGEPIHILPGIQSEYCSWGLYTRFYRSNQSPCLKYANLGDSGKPLATSLEPMFFQAGTLTAPSSGTLENVSLFCPRIVSHRRRRLQRQSKSTRTDISCSPSVPTVAKRYSIASNLTLFHFSLCITSPKNDGRLPFPYCSPLMDSPCLAN